MSEALEKLHAYYREDDNQFQIVIDMPEGTTLERTQGTKLLAIGF